MSVPWPAVRERQERSSIGIVKIDGFIWSGMLWRLFLLGLVAAVGHKAAVQSFYPVRLDDPHAIYLTRQDLAHRAMA